MDKQGVENKVVLVTGAARRIGAVIAERFHRRGCKVILHCHRSRSAAENLASQLNQRKSGSAAVVQADLTDKLQLSDLAQRSLAAFKRLDFVINNEQWKLDYSTPSSIIITS